MDDNTATEQSMQDVASRVEEALFPDEAEPIVTDEEEVLEDAEELPESDDSESDEDEGSEDEVEELTDEDATLAAYLGVDEDRLVVGEDGQVSLNAIIDGETKVVPLKELAASYQLQGHVNNKSMALETQRKEFETLRQETYNDLKTQMDGVQQLSKVLEQQLVGEYNNIDWNTLRSEDPAQWSALRQEYSEKAQQIQTARDLMTEEQNRLEGEAKKEQQGNVNQYMSREREQLIEKNPDWADSGKRKAALEDMKTFMSSTYGYAPDDMERVSDHRLIEVIKDAQAYRQGKKAAEKKKVKLVPKFQKPGAARTNAAQLAKARGKKAQKAAVRKSGGSIQSVADALLDRM